MNKTMIALVATEARAALAGSEADSLKERLRIAMKTVQNHWMATDENQQFLGAVAAVMGLSTEKEKAQLTAELRILQGLQSAASGVPVDMGALLGTSNPDEIVGLSKLWQEAKESEVSDGRD